MIEDLLEICNDLINYALKSSTLTDNESDYIISVVRKAIFVILLELARKSTSQNRF